MKMCQDTLNLVKIRQKYQALYVKIQVCVILLEATKCSATIHRMHCCASMAMLSVFITLLTVTYISTLQTEHTVAFSWQQWLCKHATMLCYT
jgi:hypothetical protein